MIIPNIASALPSLLYLLSSTPTHNDEQQRTTASIIVPHRQPSFTERIDPRLVAFSIEADRWPAWAGDAVGHRNEFTHQLLKNLHERTGVPAAIRVGGASL
jgi:hypothetical protein